MDQDDDGGCSRRRPILERVGPSSSAVDSVAAPAVLPELDAGSQGMLNVARGSPDNEPLGSAAIALAVAANSLEGPIDGSPIAAKASSSNDEVAPSMVSPTFVRFEVVEDLKLPLIGCTSPGPASLEPMDSQVPALQITECSSGLSKDIGLQGDDYEGGGCDEATEYLPASPRSPLCFPFDEVMEMPASPRTPPPSPPIPDFNLLVSPPLQSQAPVKPLLVYSRRRFHQSGISAVGDEAAVSLMAVVAATTAATLPLTNPTASWAGLAPAAATVLTPTVAGEPSPSTKDAEVTQVAPAPTLASASANPATSSVGPPPSPPPTVATVLSPVAAGEPSREDATLEAPALPEARAVFFNRITQRTTGLATDTAIGPPASTPNQEAPVPLLLLAPSLVDTAASRAAFINKLAWRAGGLLPVPAINKRRGKTLPPGDTPRRSRRLAGAKTEFGLNDLERRTKKKAMRTLELIEEHDGIDQQALDDYAKLFGQPLPDSHI